MSLQADDLRGGPQVAPDTLEAAILLQRQGSVLGPPAAQAPLATAVFHQHHAASSMRPTAGSTAQDSRHSIIEGTAQAAEHSSLHNAQQPPQGPGDSEQQAVHTHSAEHDRLPVEDDPGVLSKGGHRQPDVRTPPIPDTSPVAGNSQGVDTADAPEVSKKGQHHQGKADTVQSPESMRGHQEADDWRQEQRLWLASPSGLSETAGLQLKPESAASTAPPSRADSRISVGDQPASLASKQGRSQRPAKVGLPPCSQARVSIHSMSHTHEETSRASRLCVGAAASASVGSLPQTLQPSI